jgi:hypothetical protein
MSSLGPAPAYDASQWESSLTVRVGESYVCRTCGQVAMITQGGVGNQEMICCSRPMDKVGPIGGLRR